MASYSNQKCWNCLETLCTFLHCSSFARFHWVDRELQKYLNIQTTYTHHVIVVFLRRTNWEFKISFHPRWNVWNVWNVWRHSLPRWHKGSFVYKHLCKYCIVFKHLCKYYIVLDTHKGVMTSNDVREECLECHMTSKDVREECYIIVMK